MMITLAAEEATAMPASCPAPAMPVFTVTLHAGPAIAIAAPDAGAAFAQAQTIARTTATGIVRDENGTIV